MHRYVIITLASAETLTLFPMLFWGIYLYMSADAVQNLELSKMMTILSIAVAYAATVLFGAYKAVQNIKRPLIAYGILFIPLVVLSIGYLLH